MVEENNQVNQKKRSTPLIEEAVRLADCRWLIAFQHELDTVRVEAGNRAV